MSRQSQQSEPRAEGVEGVLEAASRTSLTRVGVARLAAAAPADLLRQAFAGALERVGVDAAAALAFALASTGEKLAPEPLAALFAEARSIEPLAALVPCVEGEAIAFLLDLPEKHRVSIATDALACFLAVQLLDGGPPPARLLTRLRSLLRVALDPDSASLLAHATKGVGDRELEAAALRQVHPDDVATIAGFAREVAAPLRKQPLDFLPEREALRIGAEYTVVRADPKVGRNDPCPCGSGKKYKKCCAGRTDAQAPASAAAQFERLGANEPGLRRQLFSRLRPAELGRLDPTTLDGEDLADALTRLLRHQRWQDAERFLEVLLPQVAVTFPDTPPEEFRVQLIDAALDAGALDVARAHVALLPPEHPLRREYELEFTLALRQPEALEQLEAFLAESLREERGDLVSAAFALLDHYPALGILVARGCIAADRLNDSEILLEHIEHARDRLLLPPEERFWKVLDLLCHESAAARFDEADEEERQRLSREVQRLRGDLASAGERTRKLESDLRRRQGEMESLGGGRGRPGDAEPAKVDELEAERRRLRAKIEELKGEIAEGAAQRTELRKALSRVGEAEAQATSPTAVERDEPRDDDEAGAGLDAPRFVLVPSWSTVAARSLAALNTRVAAQSIRTVSALAAGDSLEWRGVKRMRAAADTYSARVDRTHRVLFRFGERSLEVLDVVPRKDLDTAVHRR